jgi:hypothetical protein
MSEFLVENDADGGAVIVDRRADCDFAPPVQEIAFVIPVQHREAVALALLGPPKSEMIERAAREIAAQLSIPDDWPYWLDGANAVLNAALTNPEPQSEPGTERPT